MFVDQQYPSSKTPEHLQACLLDHQTRIVRTMSDLEKSVKLKITSSEAGETYHVSNRLGFLSTPPGTGKTICMLSILGESLDRGYRAVQKHSATLSGMVVEQEDTIFLPVNLVVVPGTLLHQWQQEIRDFTNLSVHTIQKRTDLAKLPFFAEEHPCGIVLCPAGMYNSLCGSTPNHIFMRVVFDEVQAIHIPGTKRVHAQFYWFLSASFQNLRATTCMNRGFLMNLLKELKDIGPLHEELWHAICVQANKAFLQDSMKLANPIVDHYTVHALEDVTDFTLSLMLHTLYNDGAQVACANFCQYFDDWHALCASLVKPMQEGDYAFAGSPRLDTTKRSRDVPMEEGEVSPPPRTTRRITSKKHTPGVELGAREGALMCPITHHRIHTVAVVPCCGKAFEFGALLRALDKRDTCPMCRTTLEVSTLRVHAPSATPRNTATSKLGKLAQLVKEAAEDTRVHLVVFVPSDKMQETEVAVREMAEELSIPNLFLLAGRIPARTLSQFAQSARGILLVDQKKHGFGLNIPHATHMVILDPPSDAMETEQLIGRSNRYGRHGSLRVAILQDA